MGTERGTEAQRVKDEAARTVQATMRGQGSRTEVPRSRERQARYEAVWGSYDDPRRTLQPQVLVEANRLAKEQHRLHVWRIYGSFLLRALARCNRLQIEGLAIRGLGVPRTGEL